MITDNTSGWGRKLSYVIAFSNDGCTDVTRRYVRNAASYGRDRNRCPEEVLMYIANEIKQMRRDGLSKEEKRRLIREDQREDRELRDYVVYALTSELERQLCGSGSRHPHNHRGRGGDEITVPERAFTGAEAYRRARERGGGGNAGDGQDGQQPPREGEGR